MSTLRIKSDVAFSGVGFPVLVPLLNGFTLRSLVNLQRFADAAPLTSAKDDVSGISVAVQTSGTVTTSNMSGGGVITSQSRASAHDMDRLCAGVGDLDAADSPAGIVTVSHTRSGQPSFARTPRRGPKQRSLWEFAW